MKLDYILTEASKRTNLQPWMLTTKKDVSNWIKTLSFHLNDEFLKKKIHINSDLELDSSSQNILIDMSEPDLDDMRQRMVSNKIDPDSPDSWEDMGHEMFPGILMSYQGRTVLPVQFAYSGKFSINAPLSTMLGCPREVRQNNMSSDRYRTFVIENARLRNMEGFPRRVFGGATISSWLPLEDFSGMNPDSGVTEILKLTFPRIGSFNGLSKRIGSVMIESDIDSFQGIENTGIRKMWLFPNKKYKGMLNILRAPKLESVSNAAWMKHNSFDEAMAIFTKHLEGEKDLINCKRDLISAGLKEFAVA